MIIQFNFGATDADQCFNVENAMLYSRVSEFRGGKEREKERKENNTEKIPVTYTYVICTPISPHYVKIHTWNIIKDI